MGAFDGYINIKFKVMKNNSLLFMLILAVVVLQCCRPANKAESMGDTTTAVDHVVVNTPNTPGSEPMGDGIQTVMFLEKATLMTTLETEWARLATEKARNIQVRDFGKNVVKEQAEIKGPLNAIARAKGLKLPTALSENEQERLREMRRMENDDFERLYLKMAMEDYRKNIALFRGAGNSPDTMISNLARRFLPVLEKHQLQVMKLRGL
jgi:putative membrane protein